MHVRYCRQTDPGRELNKTAYHAILDRGQQPVLSTLAAVMTFLVMITIVTAMALFLVHPDGIRAEAVSAGMDKSQNFNNQWPGMATAI